MASSTEISEEITLSGPLNFVDGAPPCPDVLADLVESYLDDAARASVCLSLDGGKKRPQIKPTITDFGDASIVEVCEALHQIAWSHCSIKGVRARYVGQMHTRDANDRIKPNPERAYFDVDPDIDASPDDGDTNKPSGSYVRDLEEVNIRTLRMLQTSSQTVLRRDEQHHRDRIKVEEAKANRDVELARIDVTKMESKAAGERKGKIYDTAVGLLPAAFTKAMERWGTDAPKDEGVNLQPAERIEGYLTAKELGVFVSGIGDKRWADMKASTTYTECREILTGLSGDLPGKMVEAGLPVGKMAEIASWEDPKPDAVAKTEPKDEPTDEPKDEAAE